MLGAYLRLAKRCNCLLLGCAVPAGRKTAGDDAIK